MLHAGKSFVWSAARSQNKCLQRDVFLRGNGRIKIVNFSRLTFASGCETTISQLRGKRCDTRNEDGYDLIACPAFPAGQRNEIGAVFVSGCSLTGQQN